MTRVAVFLTMFILSLSRRNAHPDAGVISVSEDPLGMEGKKTKAEYRCSGGRADA